MKSLAIAAVSFVSVFISASRLHRHPPTHRRFIIFAVLFWLIFSVWEGLCLCVCDRWQVVQLALPLFCVCVTPLGGQNKNKALHVWVFEAA